ncbi:MAG: HAMP domain-containing protein, partial [Anaerolineales bacterium]
AALGGEGIIRLEGKVVYQAEAPVYGGEAGWVRLGLYQAPLWAEVGRVVRTGFFGLLWAVGLGVGLGYFLLTRTLEPLYQMAEGAARLGQGEWVRFPEPTGELGLLGRALNRMVEEVKRRQRELTLLNRILAESHALRVEELVDRVLSLLVRELAFTCGEFWLEGRVLRSRGCQEACPAGEARDLVEEALRRGQVVGTVAGVITGVAQDLLEIQVGEERKLLPFVVALVPEVNLAQGWIVIDPPAGW